MDVRLAEEAEIDHLARIWYDGWQDAHARILPAELYQLYGGIDEDSIQAWLFWDDHRRCRSGD